MPDLAMSTGVKRRARGSLRPSVLFNMFLERDEEAPDGFARQSRQGLAVQRTIGTGPINGLFTKRGVFSDDLFTLSDDELYREDDLLGLVSGTGAASFAPGRFEMLFTRGQIARSYDGDTLEDAGNVDDDDLPYNVRALAYLGGYFFAVRDGTNRIYWSASQDGRTWDGLDFAAAESSPDNLLDLYVVNDTLWLLGEESVEIWQLTGDADAPIARIEGLLLKKGVIETGCATEADNTLFWWGHDHLVYRGAQGAPQAISEEWLAAIMERSSLRGVFSYTFEGKVVVCIRTDEGTFGFDVALGRWSELGTYGFTGWRVCNTATPGGGLVFGDSEDGSIWAFDLDTWGDGDYMERRFSASFTLPGGTVIGNKICLVGNPGNTTLLSGEGSDPQIEIRASRDNGKTWGPWRSTSLGVQGRYRQRIEIRRWGLFDAAGGIFEFRVTAPVDFRASRVYANEPGGGRSSR